MEPWNGNSKQQNDLYLLEKAIEQSTEIFRSLGPEVVELVYQGANNDIDVANERLIRLSESNNTERTTELTQTLKSLGIPVPPTTVGVSDDQRLAAMLQVFYARIEKKQIRSTPVFNQPPALGPNESIPVSCLFPSEGCGGNHIDITGPLLDWHDEKTLGFTSMDNESTPAAMIVEGYSGLTTNLKQRKCERKPGNEYVQDDFLGSELQDVGRGSF